MPAATQLHGLARAAAAIRMPWTGPYADSLKANEKPLSGIARAAAAFAADDAKTSGEPRGIDRAANAISLPTASPAPTNPKPTSGAQSPGPVAWNPAIETEMNAAKANDAKRFDDPVFCAAFRFVRTRSMAREGAANVKLNRFMDGIGAAGITNKVRDTLKVRGLTWTVEAFTAFEAGLFSLSKSAGKDLEDALGLLTKLIAQD